MSFLDYNLYENILNPHELNTSDLVWYLSKCDLIAGSTDNKTIQLAPYTSKFEHEKPNWLQVYNVLFNVILVGLILLSGMTGNILSCLVLIRDRTHGTTSLILTALAICDTLFLIMCLFFQFLRNFAEFTLWLEFITLYAHISKFLYGAGTTVRMMRNWLVVVVTVERWVAVCKPLHAPRICTRSTARWTICFLAVLCAFYNIPNYLIVDAALLFCYGPKQVFAGLSANQTFTWSVDELPQGILMQYSNMRPWYNNNYSFRLGYSLISYTILVISLPTSIIFVLNVLLIRGIKYANVRRAHMMARIDYVNRQQYQQQKQHEQRHQISKSISSDCSKTTEKPRSCFVRMDKSTRSRSGEVNRLCVGVIVIYLICEFPAVGYQVILLLKQRKAMELTKPVTNFLVCLNSGVNFFVYVFLGRRFRSQLKDLLRRACCRCFSVNKYESDNRSTYQAKNHGVHINIQTVPTETIKLIDRNQPSSSNNEENTELIHKNDQVDDRPHQDHLHPAESSQSRLPCGKCLNLSGKTRRRLPDDSECHQTTISFVEV